MNRIVAKAPDRRAIPSQTVGGASMLSTIANVTDISSDPAWHDNAILIGELATLNSRISRYITSTLDADAQRGEPVSPADEAALGTALVELGERLRDRSRDQLLTDATVVTDGGALWDGCRLSEPVVPCALPGSSQPPPSIRSAVEPTREELSDLDEQANNLVIGTISTPIVQDRPEFQLSDGMDDGITTDPA